MSSEIADLAIRELDTCISYIDQINEARKIVEDVQRDSRIPDDTQSKLNKVIELLNSDNTPES